MKIQIGNISETNRDDYELSDNQDKWETIAESVGDFIEWLNDCDDDNEAGYGCDVAENNWFRVIE